MFHFFFFKQKTAYEMRISDWSSDVCSSDLDRTPRIEAPTGITLLGGEHLPGMTPEDRVQAFVKGPAAQNSNLHFLNTHPTGGPFAHYENPDACIDDIRSTFRHLRSHKLGRASFRVQGRHDE